MSTPPSARTQGWQKLHRGLMACLSKHGQAGEEERQHLVHSFTNGRTSSTRDLSTQEMIDLMRKLDGKPSVMLSSPQDVTKHDTPRARAVSQPAPAGLKAKRSAALKLMGEQDICPRTPGNTWTKETWDGINGWLLNYGAVKKRFNQLTEEEWVLILNQLYGVARNNSASHSKKGSPAPPEE